MGVIVEDIKIRNEFDTAVTTDYLLGNVGEKVTIEVDFRVEEMFVTENLEDSDRIIINVHPYMVNTHDQKDIVFCEQAIFENYRVGDSISIYNQQYLNYSPYVVYEKVDNSDIVNQAIKVTHPGGAAVDFTLDPFRSLDANSYIAITTPITAVKYRWNMIGNNELDTFLNKIDGQINQFRAGDVDASDLATYNAMILDAPVTNDYGGASVKGNGIGANDRYQKFRITHSTIITPFFLAGQKFDLEDGIPPSYYLSAECLKYIVSIDAGRNLNDPNFIQTESFSANEGNTGWFEENFNGLSSKYSVGDVRYIRQDLSVIDAVELTDNIQTVEIDIISEDAVFSVNNTEFALNFSILPDEKEDYTFNGKNIIENFHFDRAFNVADGASSVAGDNNATDQQVFTGVVGVVGTDLVANDKLTITATIDFGATSVADLTEQDFEYFLWVSVQDHLKVGEDSDRVALRVDVQPFYIDLTDDGMITQTTKFLRHYESDVLTEGTDTLIARVEDDVLSYTQFSIDRLGRTTDDISISSIECELIAKKLDGSEFELEQFSQSFSGSLIVNDSQFIDASSERVFKMPDADARKTISTKRRIDLDTTDLRFYEVYYPFLMRWEYWEALSGVDSDAFDTNEENNGQNEDWHRYNTLADWDIYFRFTINSSKNGTAQRYQTDTLIETFDYEEDTEWINEDIISVDADTLVDTGGLLISPTKIIASKEYSGASVPATADDVEWVLRIEVHEQGGIVDIRYLSSVYDWTQFSWFKSVDATNKVTKFKSGNIFTAEALIDFGKLPSDSSLKISARIYDEAGLAPIPANAKLLEDGTVKNLEDASIKIIE